MITAPAQATKPANAPAHAAPQDHAARVKAAVTRFTSAAAMIRQIKRAEDALAYFAAASSTRARQ